MLNSVYAIVKEGKIQPIEPLYLEEGRRLLVTLLPDSDDSFWREVSQSTLDMIWDNREDDVYAELLNV